MKEMLTKHNFITQCIAVFGLNVGTDTVVWKDLTGQSVHYKLTRSIQSKTLVKMNKKYYNFNS